MTISLVDLAIYALAIVALFMTPGPVWVALVARSLAHGPRAAVPLALGVVIGDLVWPLVAILGVSWITSVYSGFLHVLQWAAVVIFIVMGVGLIRNAGAALTEDSRLNKKGWLAGFLAGFAVIMSNPKAVLFYMGILPGFFDVGSLVWADILAVLVISAVVPFLGNLALALLVGCARQLLKSETSLRKVNIGSGILLILVGLAISLS